MSNKDDDFDIAPPENVGTEIIDPKMPSNLDFQENNQNQSKPKLIVPLDPIDANSLAIKSYTLKGHVAFSIPPQYPIGSIAPLNTPSFPVNDLTYEQNSGGLWGLWESIVGYVKRQLIIDDGYIYLLSKERNGLRSVGLWRLVDLFKVFADLQQSELRLVVQIQGSSQLLTKDFYCSQLNNVVARLREKTNALGLSLVS